MIPRLKADLGAAELFASLKFPSRDDVPNFEDAFASELGQRHAIAFPYGRTGLVMLLKALGLDGDEVICPAYTCVVVPHAITISGNIPVFVDSQESDFLMDLELVEQAVTPRTKAIIATSLFGQPVNLDQLRDFQQRHPHILVIQDCAHSFGAEWNGEPVYRAGTAAIFGLNISKVMTSIFGGMVTTDDDQLADRLREIRSEELSRGGWRKSLSRMCYLWAVTPAFTPLGFRCVKALLNSGLLDRFTKYYDESVIDMPADYLSEMVPIEARVGLAQVRKYRKILTHRKQMAKAWHEQLAHADHLQLPPWNEGASWSHFVVRTDGVEEALSLAEKIGVELGTLIEYNIPEMKAYREHRFVDRGVAHKFVGRTLNLPVHCGVSERTVEKVSRMLRASATSRDRDTQRKAA